MRHDILNVSIWNFFVCNVNLETVQGINDSTTQNIIDGSTIRETFRKHMNYRFSVLVVKRSFSKLRFGEVRSEPSDQDIRIGCMVF